MTSIETVAPAKPDRLAAARAAREAKKAQKVAAAPSAPQAPPTAADANEGVDRAIGQRAAAEVAALAILTTEGPSNNTRVALRLEDDHAARLRAARQRADIGDVVEPDVQVRVTKLGDGKISMGKHIAGIGEAHFEWKEEATFPLSVAKSLEDRGFVEIQ